MNSKMNLKEAFRGKANIDFMSHRSFFNALSGLVVLSSIVLTATLGLNFGIDFAGGYEIHAGFSSSVTENQIKDLIRPLGIKDARVQRFGEVQDNEFLIMVRKHGTLDKQVKDAIAQDITHLAGGVGKLTLLEIAQSGESIKVAFSTPIDKTKVRSVIEQHGVYIKSIEVGDRTDEPVYDITIVSLSDRIGDALKKGTVPGTVKRVEFVGPQVGAQLRNQGIMAVVWALFFILLYVGVRFDLFFAPGAIVALIHDVTITVGVFSLLQLEFNLPIIAAILAIVGYSLNDTIVVYDRIRENTLRLRGRDLSGVVNASLNQTLSRTLLTSFTTLLVVIALLLFGGGIIRDFSIALCIGIVVGTYSSIAIAAPLYVFMRKHYTKETTTPQSSRAIVT